MNDIDVILMRLDGRLGNQLFQLAVALNISQKFNVKILLDDYLPSRKGFDRFLFEELTVFNYCQYCSPFQLFFNRLQHNNVFRSFFHKSSDLFIEAERSNERLDLTRLYKSYSGFFQSPSYFPDKKVVVDAFSIRSEFICEPLAKLLDLARSTSCLALSVRRGDFLSNSHLGVCTHDYYLQAIEFIKLQRSIDRILVFSDDIAYCRELLAQCQDRIIYVEGLTPAKSLYLMSQCQHFAIANSTFSWWGAWLAEHPDKLVIAPDPWNDGEAVLPDFIPSDWMALTKHPIRNTPQFKT